MNPRLQYLFPFSLRTRHSIHARLLAGSLAVAMMGFGQPVFAQRTSADSGDRAQEEPAPEGGDVEFPSDDKGPLSTAWEEVRAGDAASDAAKHGEAVEHYEKALQLLGNAPEWATQVNELRRVIGNSYFERYHVVGDPVDLHKAKSFLQAHVIELPPDMDESRKAAQHTIGEIEAELKRLKSEQNASGAGENEVELVDPPDHYKQAALSPTHSERKMYRVGLGTAIGGLASAVAAGTFAYLFYKGNDEALKALERNDGETSRRLFDARNTYGTISAISGGVAAALLITSTALFVTNSKGRKKRSAGRMARVKNRWIPRFGPAVGVSPTFPR